MDTQDFTQDWFLFIWDYLKFWKCIFFWDDLEVQKVNFWQDISHQQWRKFDSTTFKQQPCFWAAFCPKLWPCKFWQVAFGPKWRFCGNNLANQCLKECSKYHFWTLELQWLLPTQFEWYNNISQLRNNCDNDSSLRINKYNNKSTTTSV